MNADNVMQCWHVQLHIKEEKERKEDVEKELRKDKREEMKKERNKRREKQVNREWKGRK
jgi:hypothetical protein